MSTVQNTEVQTENRVTAWVLAYLVAIKAQLVADFSALKQELELVRQQALTEGIRQRRMYDRGQTNLGNLFIGIMIAAIIAIRVFIPTVQDAIASSNVSGTTKTILDMLSLFAALLLLISLASPLMNRS
jgi:hypothetical protein